MTEQLTETTTTPEPERHGPLWREVYAGGSPQAEQVQFERLAREIMQVQLKNRRRAGARGAAHPVDRAVHAKATLAVDDARLTFYDLPADLRVGFAQPGLSYRTHVRFSNAAGTARPDLERDLRGVALRVVVSDEEQHDLLATNYHTSHARDARQFVKFAHATAGGGLSRVVGVARLMVVCGPFETVRMLVRVREGLRRIGSIATETYWSRGAVSWGETLAVRYLLRPKPAGPEAPVPARAVPDFLSREVAGRLADGDVRFELCIVRFRDERSTPIEDTSVEWRLSEGDPVPVAELTIPRPPAVGVADVAEPKALRSIDFNPWNTTGDFRPLGNLNRARKAAYDAGAAHRHQLRWHPEVPLRNTVLSSAARSVFRLVNRFRPWHRLGVRLGLLNLDALRAVLRRSNLIDTEEREAPPQPRPVPPALPPETARVFRTYNGDHNDLSAPAMGAVGATFGRNLPADLRPDLLDRPNPITVADRLLERKVFRPATSLNLLAAAWIQFQVHDWVHHGRYPLGRQDIVVPLPAGRDRWVNSVGGEPENVMRIAGNEPLPPLRDATTPRFANKVSHWWDASEVYGSDEEKAHALRSGAKLTMTEDGYLPRDVDGSTLTGFNDGWWLGLSGLHTLFVREHNLLCDELRARYRGWDDERVYQTARLIVSALIAKIHTVEWTPAILATETLDLGMNTNWNGPPAHEWLTRLGIWLLDTHAAVGIPSTVPDHHAAPFSLTEDFVTVYRMHPLLPDDYVLRDHRTGEVRRRLEFSDLQGTNADVQLRAAGLDSVLYSFGLSYPGAITLHNYPRSMRRFVRIDDVGNGEIVDLAVVDLVRSRHRGIPRYNDFRAGLHMPRITQWEKMCADPASVEALKEVYGSVDEVDTMVGLFAETPPEGFGFSDTAFRIFLLMASRRLQSDRFLTVDFRPEIYSPLGMDWIATNTMASVILRHCPDLAGVLPRDGNAFRPWRAR